MDANTSGAPPDPPDPAARAHLTFVEPARGVAQISNLSVSPGIASFGEVFEVFQALAVARSVWSAWSLLPLSSLQPPTKAPASWTHSIRFARFGCGCAVHKLRGRASGAVRGRSKLRGQLEVAGDHSGNRNIFVQLLPAQRITIDLNGDAFQLFVGGCFKPFKSSGGERHNPAVG